MMKKTFFAVLTLIVLAAGFGQLSTAHSIKVPPFSGADAFGKQVSLADFEGQTKVLYFWATWCPACRQDTDNINKIQDTLQKKGAAFISVSLDKDIDRLKGYIEQRQIAFPVLFDGKGWENEIAQIYGVRATPHFFIIDKNNELVTEGSWSKQLEAYFSANE